MTTESDFLQFAATSGATGLLIAWGLQVLKHSTLPLFASLGTTEGKAKANFLTSAVVSGLAALAINYRFEVQPLAQGGAFTLTVTGSLVGMLHGLFHWAWQLANTHGMYKLFIVPAEVQGEIRGILRQLLAEQLNQSKGDGK